MAAPGYGVGAGFDESGQFANYQAPGFSPGGASQSVNPEFRGAPLRNVRTLSGGRMVEYGPGAIEQEADIQDRIARRRAQMQSELLGQYGPEVLAPGADVLTERGLAARHGQPSGDVQAQVSGRAAEGAAERTNRLFLEGMRGQAQMGAARLRQPAESARLPEAQAIQLRSYQDALSRTESILADPYTREGEPLKPEDLTRIQEYRRRLRASILPMTDDRFQGFTPEEVEDYLREKEDGAGGS
jgi:hypothetical protein